MINHVRTVLLNQKAGPVDLPGEEYVPPAFGPRPVPTALGPVYRSLFGSSPDRAMLNYRLRQYLALLHSCELVEHVLAKDARVTYWPFDDLLVRRVALGPTVTQVAGAPGQDLYVMAAAAAVESSGRLQQQWGVDVTDGAHVTVGTYDAHGLVYQVTQGYAVTDGLSNLLTLPGSSLGYRFREGVGGGWLVDVLARPALTLAGVLAHADRLVVGPARDALFGVAPVEPYQTFRELWDRHDGLPYRLGALVLALAYRLS